MSLSVVLISTGVCENKPNYIAPLGILALAAYLRERGIQVDVIDQGLLLLTPDELARRVAAFAPDLVGLGGIITAYASMISITHALKRVMPDTPVVLGGQVVVNNVQNCFRYMGINYAIKGYGEIPLYKLCQCLQGKERLERIPGLCFLRDGWVVEVPGREFVKSLDALPLPAYDLVDMEHYATAGGMPPRLKDYVALRGRPFPPAKAFLMMGALGCVGRCTFCIHEQEYVGLKHSSLEGLRRHIGLLRDGYGIHVVTIGEEMFLPSPSKVREFVGMMNEHFPDVYWSTQARADLITPEYVQELEKGNCFGLSFGFETGSQRMLDIMQKEVRREHNIRAYRLLKSSTVLPSCSLMVGHVGETHASVRETISAVREAEVDRVLTFIAAAYPGGRVWDWAVERGVIDDSHQYLLRVSGKDAGGLNINLTAYPDWTVRAWKALVDAACASQAMHLALARMEANGQRPTLRQRLYFLRQAHCLGVVPVPLANALVGLFCAAYTMIGRWLPNSKYSKRSYRVDEFGALLPQRLQKGARSRAYSGEELEACLSRKPVLLPFDPEAESRGEPRGG